MELRLGAQLAQAAVSVLFGAGLGLYYDLLRLPRLLHGGFLSTLLCDAAFSLGALLALFTLGLGPGGGQLRLFMLFAAGAGFALWEAAPGRPIAAGERFAVRALKQSAQKRAARRKERRTHSKKFAQKVKKLFPSAARWFTIKQNSRKVPSGGKAGRRDTDSAVGPGRQP